MIRAPFSLEKTEYKAEPEASRAARTAWARLIKKVYEADPLACPHCGGEMCFLSVFEEPLVIERILRHLGL